MTARVMVWILEVGWAAAWALHLGVGWVPVALMVPSALGAGVLRPQRTLAVPMWALGALAGILTGQWLGGILLLYAMWRGASPPNLEHPAVYERLELAMVGTAALTYVDRTWAWTLPAALVFGLGTTLEVHRDPGTPRRMQLRLAGVLALAGAVGGLVVLAVVVFAPWTLAVRLLAELALATFYLFGFITALPFPKKKLFKKKFLVGKGKAHLAHSAPVVPWLVLLVGALVLVAVVVYVVRHGRRRRPRRLATPDAAEARLDRDAVEPQPFRRGPGGQTVLTRRVVQARMRRGAQRRFGPRRGETVREWLGRVYGPRAAALAAYYEEVRYGGQPDGRGRARTLQSQWPKDPEPSQDGALSERDASNEPSTARVASPPGTPVP